MMGPRGAVSRERLKHLLAESDDDDDTKPVKPKRLRAEALGDKHIKESKAVAKRARVKVRKVETTDITESEPSQTTSEDPLIQDALSKILTTRNLCTVKVEGLPKGYNYQSLLSLAPEMLACRIPRIAISHRPARTAFLEFSSHEKALSNQHRLEGMSYGGRTLITTLGKFISEDPDDYNSLKIRVSNLHKKTGKGELTRHFPTATGIALENGSKSGRSKRDVGVAVISFATSAEAVAAVNEKHGCVVRGRRVSIMFERKKSPKSIQGLIVYGLRKSTTESEVRALFPQAESIELFQLGGFAKLRYGAVEDCKLDKKNASTAEFKGRQLKVAFLRHYNVEDQINVKPVPQGAPTCRVFVKNLGRTAKEEQVKELFKSAQLVSMPKKKHGCRGFAILDFGTTEKAQKAISKRYELNSRVLKLEWATPKHAVH